MFEKGMDKRMIYYHGRAIVGGCGLFVLLLVIKDVLADLEVIRVDGVSTIMDMLMLLVGTFSAMLYMIRKRAIKDHYLLRAWKIFIILTIYSIIPMLPQLLVHQSFIVGNRITFAFLSVIQFVVFSFFTAFLFIQSVRIKRELKN